MIVHQINNKVYDKPRIDETVQVVTTEIWVCDNSNGTERYSMHIHAIQFQVQDRTGIKICNLHKKLCNDLLRFSCELYS